MAERIEGYYTFEESDYHLEEKNGKPSRCEQNFRLLDIALKDDHY